MKSDASTTIEPAPQSGVNAWPAIGPSSRMATGPGRHYFLLLIITVAALVLRVAGINTHSLWYDEAITDQVTQATLSDIATGRARDNGSAPLYYVVAWAWTELFGRSEAALRSFSVLCGTLAVPLLAILGRRLIGERCGFVAAALLAVSPQAIELSDEARCYPLLQLLAVAGTLFLLRWLEGRRIVDLFAYLVTLLLCCWTHYYALAMPLVHAIGIAVLPRDRRRDLAFLAGISAVAAVWSLWLPVFLAQLHTPNNLSRMEGRWPLQFLATPLCFAFGRTLAWRDSPRWLLAAASLAAVATFWFSAGIGVLRHRDRQFAQTLLTAWAATPILVPLALAITVTPVYAVRYATLGLPAFLLLAAQGLLALRPRMLLSCCVIVFSLTGLSVANYFRHPLRDDWRSATAAMLTSPLKDAPVIFDTDIEIVPFRYYAEKYGLAPHKMIGLISGINDDGTLPGVHFQDGRRALDPSGDCVAAIRGWPAFRLALCVPNAPAEQYVQLFARHGYVPQGAQHFHRIDVIDFVRSPGKAALKPKIVRPRI